MADDKGKPQHNAVAAPRVDTEQLVEPYAAGKPVGERQDGAGAGPRHGDRHDALPPGDTARRREQGTPQGDKEEPDAEHRGRPAGLTSGAATGSGSGAGGGGTGLTEEPDPDSAGGGGRGPGFAHRRT